MKPLSGKVKLTVSASEGGREDPTQIMQTGILCARAIVLLLHFPKVPSRIYIFLIVVIKKLKPIRFGAIFKHV